MASNIEAVKNYQKNSRNTQCDKGDGDSQETATKVTNQ